MRIPILLSMFFKEEKKKIKFSRKIVNSEKEKNSKLISNT